MKRLDLSPNRAEEAFALLGTWRATFLAEDGSEPEGTGLTARMPIPDEVMEPLLTKGIGRLIDVEQWTDMQVASALYTDPSETGANLRRTCSSVEELTCDVESLVDALVCTDICRLYTRYDEAMWLLSQEVQWPLETAEERLLLFKLGMRLSTDTSQEQ